MVLPAEFPNFLRYHNRQEIGNLRTASQIFEHIFIKLSDLRDRALQVICNRLYFTEMLDPVIEVSIQVMPQHDIGMTGRMIADFHDGLPYKKRVFDGMQSLGEGCGTRYRTA
jgi:hypothetical protein